jgi:hypothetical protein
MLMKPGAKQPSIASSGASRLAVIPLVCTVAAVACSSSSRDNGSTTPALSTTGGSVTFTMDSVVPAGGETHKCQFVTAPPDASFVVSGRHEYTPGSHHMLLFRTDLTAIPAGMDKPADCYDSASGGFMSHIRGLVYAAQTPTGEMAYPPASVSRSPAARSS